MLLFILLALSIFTFGCKKEEPPALKQYLRFKLDGVAIECNENLNASTYNGQLLHVSATYDNIDLELEIIEDGNLVPEQYIFSADKYRRASLWVDGIYHYAGDNGLYNSVSGSGEITIAEISSNTAKGTFRFTTDSTVSHSSKNITDGEFYLKVHQ
jgi:hypothetical protein